jgi:hypothetical protein
MMTYRISSHWDARTNRLHGEEYETMDAAMLPLRRYLVSAS